MKKIITGIAIFLLMALAFTACQKDNTGPENKISETQLTPQQVALKKGMQQAAIVIAQISNNKAIQDEVQRLINKGIYDDDYIKFKDLFHPQSNPKLKSVSTTLFAQAFKKVVSSGNYKHLKSTNVSDLEQFLIDNNLVLYVPYPVTDYPENMRTPTVSWNPLTNDSVGMGYVISNFKSTSSVETVPKVNESYSEDHPVYIINPAMVDAGSGTGTGDSDSGLDNGNSGKTHYLIRLVDMKIKEQLDAFYNGASEIQFVFADGFIVDKDNRIVKVDPHISTVYKFKRRMIRKKQWKHISITIDPDWNNEQTVNYFGAVEIDVLGTVTLNATVGVKYKIDSDNYATASASAKYTFKSQNDFIGEREFTRDYFFASQSNPSLEGHGTYNGNVIRPNGGAMDFTTKIIEY